MVIYGLLILLFISVVVNGVLLALKNSYSDGLKQARMDIKNLVDLIGLTTEGWEVRVRPKIRNNGVLSFVTKASPGEYQRFNYRGIKFDDLETALVAQKMFNSGVGEEYIVHLGGTPRGGTLWDENKVGCQLADEG